MKNTIEYTLEYKQFKNKDIYLYKVSSNSSLISKISGYTDKEGIEKLLKGNIPNIKYQYILLSKEELNMFRNYYFIEVFEKIEKSFDFIYDNIDNENYDLFKLNYSFHYIYDLEENLIPLFISLNKPMYLLNNKDYNLEKIQDLLKNDERIISTFKESAYQKELSNKNNVIITNIPYYNAENDKDKYIDIGFAPTNEDWNMILNLANKYNQVKKSGYIPNLSLIVLESGILGFKPKRNLILK